jgi:hydrogenase maturation protease
LSDTLNTILVIGLGNPILTDDGIGWRVAQGIRQWLAENPPTLAAVQVIEASVGGLTLAEMMIGFRRAVIIDAILTGGIPGSVYHFKLSVLPPTLNTSSAHDTTLSTALNTLRHYDVVLPEDDAIDIIAIEACDVLTFSDQCTPTVQKSIPTAVQAVVRLLKQFSAF